MKRRTILLAMLVVVALITGLVWLLLRNPEPVYHGKRLSEWLPLTVGAGDVDRTLIDPDSARLDPGPAEAVRQIGTNAIPTLLRMLRAQDSRLTLKFIGLVRHQHIVKINFIPASFRNLEAAVAFRSLGTTASNAVPALIQIYEKRISKTSQMAAADSLTRIGPAAAAAVPALLRSVDDTNENVEVREAAIMALGRIHAQPGLVVPGLTKCLADSEPGVRTQAAAALAAYGSDAGAGVK